MSRRSVRILSKSKRDTPSAEEPIRKRKAEEDLDRDMQVDKRRQQFQIQNQWVPMSHNSSVITTTLVPSNDGIRSEQTTPHEFAIGTQFRFQNYFTTPISQRFSPLPKLSWADSKEVWSVMQQKDQQYVRDQGVLNKHPCLQSRMRAILLDWLIEVCEVYRLHRETYYLAVDFFDRYLMTQNNIQKTQLQLLGITSLFISAKLEEIYPPKLTEFAYVTDGACTEDDILSQELIMLMALKWDLTPMTVNAWLNVYMQLTNVGNMQQKEKAFVFPQYSAHAFIQIIRLIDLCMLDMGCLQFCYSVIATSALYHMSSEHIALQVSGYNWIDIAPCVEWMSPFAITIRETGLVELKFFPQVTADNAHNIQTHCVDLALLEKAQARQADAFHARASPDHERQVVEMLTPPSSSRKRDNSE